MSTDIGLLVLRVVVGLLLAGHGMQKVSHRLGGHGLQGGIDEFRGDGFRGGAVTALTAGVSQVGAGLLLAVGLLVPAAAMAAIGVMTVAATVKRPHGLWVQHDGYEFPLVLVTVAAALAFTGGGAFSLDAALGLDDRIADVAGWVGLAAVLIGAGAGLLTVAVLRDPHPSDRTEP